MKGHTARAIAAQLGAKSLGARSREYLFSGERVALELEQEDDKRVGVRYQVLGRVDAVLGAFRIQPMEYGLLRLRREIFERLMRDSPTERGKVGLVRKRMFLRHGTFVATVSLEREREREAAGLRDSGHK